MINHKKNVKLLERKSVVYNLPNLLTISRIAVIPLIFLSVYFECSFFNYIAGVLFIAASITDYYDGKLARDRGEVSAFGRLLDPIADKLLVATALVVILAKPGMIHEISYIPVFVILCRELLVSGLREFLREVNVGLPVTRLAKWKTGFQMTALAMIFFKISLVSESITTLFSFVKSMMLALMSPSKPRKYNFDNYWNSIRIRYR